MAILDDQPGLKAEIVVAGSPLREYEDSDEDGLDILRNTTKCVEAISGSTFTVRVDADVHRLPANVTPYSLCFSVYLDGKYQDSMVLERGQQWLPSTSKGARTMKNGKYYSEAYCFSKLSINDSDPRTLSKNDKDALTKLGEITVSVERVEVLSKIQPASRVTSQSKLGVIPEKALKGRAVSHQATLQAPEPIHAFREATTNHIDTREMPYAKFIFRYRSHDALKALCIIPRSPSPVPLEERPIEELTLEESRELLRRQREREMAARKVKQEVKRENQSRASRSVTDDDDLCVVDERPRKRFRSTIDEEGIETVDLT